MSLVRSPSLRRVSLGLVLLAGSACSGQLAGGTDEPGPGETPDDSKPGTGTKPPGPGMDTTPKPGTEVTGKPPGSTTPITAPATDTAKTAGAFTASRLTREEYANTVRDLLGDTQGLSKAWPIDTNGASGFASPGQVGGQEVGQYEDAAVAIAAKVKVLDLAACDKGATEEACAASFVQKFGARAFRRPVDADEAAMFATLYKTLRAAPISADHTSAMQGLLEAILQSPRFLYRWEDGIAAADSSGLRPINQYALASRLSYFLWKSMPDDKLFEAAKNKELGDETKLAAQAGRMLQDPRAADTVADFHRQWLQLSRLETVAKDTKIYTTFTPELRDAMKAELLAFTTQAVLGEGSLEALLLGTKTSINDGLAKVYGVPGVTSKEPVPTTLDKTQRAGVLTTAAFLTVNASPYGSSPIKRGHVIRERMFCQPLQPAAGVDTTPPPDDPKKTTRETVEATTISVGGNCVGCHQLMNPLGYGLENFDGIGQFRAQEKGRDIDATGTFKDAAGEKSFKDAPSLGKAMLESEDVQKCVALQWSRFAMGREETPADATSMDFVQLHFRAGGLNLKSMITAIVRSKSFRFDGAK